MQKKSIGIWGAIVVVIVLLSLIALYMQGQDNLNQYTGTTSGITTTQTTAPKIELQDYTNEEYHYTIGIPADWRRVTKDGYDTFIHSPSASTIQVQIMPYVPQILSITQESIQADMTAAGATLISFAWNDTSSYMSMYTIMQNEELTDCIEITHFDRSNIIRIVYSFKDEYYQRMQQTVMAIIDSFRWEPQDAIPAGTVMFYSEYGNFEFAYPQNWTTSISGNAYIAQDATTGAVMSARVVESEITYEKFDKIDYANYASQGRSNYILQSYVADNNTICAQSSYIAESTQMILIQYMVATGKFEYALSFEVPQAVYGENAEMINELMRMFRIF